MIAHKFICPAIALVTMATMVAENINPENAAPVDESFVADEDQQSVEESAEEITPESAAAAEEASEEATEEPAVEVGPESDAPEADETTKEEPPKLLEETMPRDPAPGLAVRVEKLQNGDQAIDPAQVRVLAPFPAKLLAKSPVGWRIESSENAPQFTREVELAPGKHISLTVRPHVLVPDADGSAVFSIPEPGFSAPLGYHQSATVGAILSTSIRQLDKDAAELGDAIDQLQQLLVSLPKTEATEETPAALESQPKKKR